MVLVFVVVTSYDCHPGSQKLEYGPFVIPHEKQHSRETLGTIQPLTRHLWSFVKKPFLELNGRFPVCPTRSTELRMALLIQVQRINLLLLCSLFALCPTLTPTPITAIVTIKATTFTSSCVQGQSLHYF